MLKLEQITTPQVTAVVCDRCGQEMKKRGCDGEWDERISIAFRGGYHSIFGDGNAVELDLCQHCLKEVLGQWIRVTDDGWPKSVPHHAGQDSQRSIHPDRAFALQDFERGDDAEASPPRPRAFPSTSGPFEGLKEFFQQHEEGKEHE
jgi:hypothetical protein